MNTTFTLKTLFQKNTNARSPKTGVLKRKLFLLAVIFGSFMFNSNAQQISIGSPTTGVEGPGATVSFDIFIEGGGLAALDITGTLSYGGSATSGSDYTPVPSFTIPTGANSTTISIPIINDAIIEAPETVVAMLTGNPSSGVYANTSATATILDDDAGTLFISIGSPTDGVEGSTFVSYLVFIEGGLTNNTGSAITGNITYSGTAIDGVDFTGPASFTIPNGSTSALVVLPVIDDAITEPTESVVANLTGNPSIGVYANTNSTAFILDDDASVLTMSIDSPVDAVEGIGGNVSFVVSLDLFAINATGADIYGIIAFSGTATSGDDYVGAPVNFVIPNGGYNDTVVLSVVDDFCIELTESIVATISQPNVGAISSNNTATAFIMDNDLDSASISILSPVNGEEGSSDVSFVVAMDQGLQNCTGASITGTVTYMGTATPGLDFSNVTTFSIPDGNSFAVLDIPVVDDLLQEPTESVIATISSPSIGVINASAFVDTAYIVDNDSTNGFDDLYLNNLNVTIYPNPVNSMLNLDAEKEMKNYSITDLNGRLMSSGILTTKETTLNVNTLPKGCYFVTVVFEDGSTAIKKVLKQ